MKHFYAWASITFGLLAIREFAVLFARFVAWARPAKSVLTEEETGR